MIETGMERASAVPHIKVSIPPVPIDHVARTHLLADLDAAAVSSTTLVCAPPGFGKTLLLADWAARSSASGTAWVNLDEEDNDPRRLWPAVAAAVAASGAVTQSSTLRGSFAWDSGGQSEFIDGLVSALYDVTQPIRLILDGLDELTNVATLRGLATLLRTRPAHVQIVMASRFDPLLGLPRMRLAGRLSEIRVDRLRFTLAETTTLLHRAGLHLDGGQVQMLYDRTDGWPAGLRLAAAALALEPDHVGFLTEFSGDERSVADYLVGEVLGGLPPDVVEFLRAISVENPIHTDLGAALSGRDDAGSVLDDLERRTSLLTATNRSRDIHRVQPLLHTYLYADLHRRGPVRAQHLHATAAHWWAGHDEPVRALRHACRSNDAGLLLDLVHRFAVPMLLSGHHQSLREVLTELGIQVVAADARLALISALIHLDAGEVLAAKDDFRHAGASWAAYDRDTDDLAVLRRLASQLGAATDDTHGWPPDTDGLAAGPSLEPALEALLRLGRGTTQLFGENDAVAATGEFDSALALAERHGFAHLSMECQTLLGLAAVRRGDLRGASARCIPAVGAAADQGWTSSRWFGTASSVLAAAALLGAEPAEAGRLAAEALDADPTGAFPAVRFALRTIQGAARYDSHDVAGGLEAMQRARSEFGSRTAEPAHAAMAAALEFRAALGLGHYAAAVTVRGWLADRTGDTAELHLMRAWGEAVGGHDELARRMLKPVLSGTVAALLLHTPVEAWLLEASLAVAAEERPAARQALSSALAHAEPADIVRPFTHAGARVRQLLVDHHGSFGAVDSFAGRVIAAAAPEDTQHTKPLSEREQTVLTLLASLLSLEEIAEDLVISINTVKSHVRSIYTKLGVSSRRAAVLTAHESGLLANATRFG